MKWFGNLIAWDLRQIHRLQRFMHDPKRRWLRFEVGLEAEGGYWLGLGGGLLVGGLGNRLSWGHHGWLDVAR